MNILNKNFKVIELNKKESIVIQIIDTPKFYIGDLELTEYDVRNIQLEVSKGNLDFNDANRLNILDSHGFAFKFREDGVLINTPKGYNIISDMVLQMIGINKNKRK